MKEAVVVDSTCLIGLERIGRLDVLPDLFEPIFIPDEVSNEFQTFVSWLNIETPANSSLVQALKLLVDDGEAEAIALALEKNAGSSQTINKLVLWRRNLGYRSSEQSEFLFRQSKTV